MAKDLVNSGLNRVTVSLDTLDQEVFKQMSGRNLDINKILTGIESASSKGLTPIKINCVVKRNVNEKSILGLIIAAIKDTTALSITMVIEFKFSWVVQGDPHRF